MSQRAVQLYASFTLLHMNDSGHPAQDKVKDGAAAKDKAKKAKKGDGWKHNQVGSGWNFTDFE